MASIFYSYRYRPSFTFAPLYSPLIPLFFGQPLLVRRYRPVMRPSILRVSEFHPVFRHESTPSETSEVQWEQIPISHVENPSTLSNESEVKMETTDADDDQTSVQDDITIQNETQMPAESEQETEKEDETIEPETQEESSEVDTKDTQTQSADLAKESDNSSSSISEDSAESGVSIEIKPKHSCSLVRKNIVPTWETKEDDSEVTISGVSADGKLSNVTAFFNPSNCSVQVSGRVGSSESNQTEYPWGKMSQYSSYSTSFNRSFELPAECAFSSSAIRADVSDSAITIHCPKHSTPESTSKPLRVIPIV